MTLMRFALASRPALAAVAPRALAAVALWWILTEGAWGEPWLAVSAIALVVSASFLVLPPRPAGIRFSGLLAYLAFFLRQSLRGGFAVAALALRPRLALRPQVWRVVLRLPPGPGRVLLAGTMSLLPGTLSVGLEGNRLHLHVLDERLFAEADLRAAEARIARMLGHG